MPGADQARPKSVLSHRIKLFQKEIPDFSVSQLRWTAKKKWRSWQLSLLKMNEGDQVERWINSERMEDRTRLSFHFFPPGERASWGGLSLGTVPFLPKLRLKRGKNITDDGCRSMQKNYPLLLLVENCGLFFFIFYFWQWEHENQEMIVF